MRFIILAILFLTLSFAMFAWFYFPQRPHDVETKGPAEITEWVKLAVAVVTLIIGLINLRLALSNKDK